MCVSSAISTLYINQRPMHKKVGSYMIYRLQIIKYYPASQVLISRVLSSKRVY